MYVGRKVGNRAGPVRTPGPGAGAGAHPESGGHQWALADSGRFVEHMCSQFPSSSSSSLEQTVNHPLQCDNCEQAYLRVITCLDIFEPFTTKGF